jgi:hypothetical protein
MKKLLAAGVAVAALAIAPGAFAANTGTFSVSHSPMVLAGSKSTTFHLTFPQSDDSLAQINIFSGTGYNVNLSQPAGTVIGDAQATVFSHTAGLTLPLSGQVVVANPANFTQQSAACAGTPTSAAVWTLSLSVAGTPLTIPVYINPTTGAQQPLGGYRTTVCFTPYDVPEAQGGAAQGAQLLDVTFTVNGVYTTPTGGGLIKWETLATPYVPKTTTPNPAGTFEMRALVPLPIILGIHASYLPKTNTFQLNGKVTEGGLPVGGLILTILRGTTPSKLSTKSTTKTNSDGSWKTAGHLKPKKTTYFQISATTAQQDYTAQGCQNPATTVAPAGCVSATISPWSTKSSVYKVKVTATFKKNHKK